jgi:hypothetical protein
MEELLMAETIILTEHQWFEQYGVDGDGRMYETYGEDMNYINSMPVSFVWTLIDGDEGQPLIVNGRAFVNRVGYYLTKKPHNPNDIIVVDLEG